MGINVLTVKSINNDITEGGELAAAHGGELQLDTVFEDENVLAEYGRPQTGLIFYPVAGSDEVDRVELSPVNVTAQVAQLVK